MAKIVILEGSKGSGKSSLCQAVVSAINKSGNKTAVYFKKGARSEENEFLNMMEHIKSFREAPEDFVIVDRFHITEFVMSKHYHREPFAYLKNYTRFVNNKLLELEAKVIILNVSIDNIINRVEAREDVSRRQLDLPPDLIESLWLEPAKNLPGIYVWGNNTQEQFLQNVDRIVNFAILGEEF